MELKIENTKAQMRKGVLELCVLAIVAKEPAYPTDIIKKLKESRLIILEGTLYPLLNRLKDSGLLEYFWQESRTGPPRKYYRISEDGNQFFAGLRETWDELNKAVNQCTNIQNL